MKLSRIDRRKIREAYADGLTQEELSLIFGVSQATISRIVDSSKPDKQDALADRMEAFLGGATVDDGCYHSVPKNTNYNRESRPLPNALIDRQDPLAVLLAEETLKLKLENDDD